MISIIVDSGGTIGSLIVYPSALFEISIVVIACLAILLVAFIRK